MFVRLLFYFSGSPFQVLVSMLTYELQRRFRHNYGGCSPRGQFLYSRLYLLPAYLTSNKEDEARRMYIYAAVVIPNPRSRAKFEHNQPIRERYTKRVSRLKRAAADIDVVNVERVESIRCQ